MLTCTANLQPEINWSIQEETSLSLVTDIGAVGSDLNLTHGTGQQNLNAIHHDVITVSGNGTHILNFRSIPRPLFSQTGYLNFSNVKGIIFKNQSEEVADILRIRATGVGAFTEPFGGSSGDIPVHPMTSFSLLNYIEGWNPPNPAYITIVNTSPSAINCEVATVGVTGI